MKRNFLVKRTTAVILLIFAINNLNAQCNYIPSTSTSQDTLSYTFSGGTFASFGCAPIDPTYWMSGNGDFVTVNFVVPQSYPTFRVWGMNDDDSAIVSVNGANYPLTTSSASYDTKVVCGLSPGPDGVIFVNGILVGANSNTMGNYSYQNIQLNATNVSTFTVTGISGAGWGFAGASINCPLNPSGVEELLDDKLISLYPNPTNGLLYIKSNSQQSVGKLKIFSCTGQLLFEDDNFKSKAINANEINLSDGIYFLSYSDSRSLAMKKIIVMR